VHYHSLAPNFFAVPITDPVNDAEDLSDIAILLRLPAFPNLDAAPFPFR